MGKSCFFSAARYMFPFMFSSDIISCMDKKLCWCISRIQIFICFGSKPFPNTCHLVASLIFCIAVLVTLCYFHLNPGMVELYLGFYLLSFFVLKAESSLIIL